MRSLIKKFNYKCELGEVGQGPGELRYYGKNIIQEVDFTISIHGDENLRAIEPYDLSQVSRRHFVKKMNEVETKSILSIHASIGWLGTK